MITQTKHTYLVTDGNYKRTFESGANGITIPGQYNHPNLVFQNSKKGVVKSFHKALGEFLSLIDENEEMKKVSADPTAQSDYKTILYKGSETAPLERNMNEGIIYFNGKPYTFVRRAGIEQSFESIDMEVKNFNDKDSNKTDEQNFEQNRTDATVYLKQLFGKYKDQYPDLFANDNWYSIDSTKLFPMIDQRATDNDIPYAGWQRSGGGRCWPGRVLFAWLPVRVAGEFAYVGSDSAGRGAGVGRGYGNDAHLSVSFKN